jgi:hypothetical protein
VLKLSATDYIVAGFALCAGANAEPTHKTEPKPSVLVMTHNGKAIHREADWLEKPASNKSRGQPVFSQARREAGVRVAGAAAVEEDTWSAALLASGKVNLHRIANLIESGVLPGDPTDEIIDFCTFPASGIHAPGADAGENK